MDLIPRPPTLPVVQRGTTWLRGRLGRAVVASYAVALLAPWPGLWLRRPHLLAGLTVHVPPVLLGVLLFAGGFQVRVRALAGLVRRPWALLAALALHCALPLVLIPLLVLLLRGTPDADHGSGIVTAMVMIVTMPVAANATVWTAKGDGDQPSMVAAVLGSTLLSPVTTPLVMRALTLQVHGAWTHTLTVAAELSQGGFALAGIVAPCALGVCCRLALSAAGADTLEAGISLLALLASLVTTYLNASGALGACLAQPRPLLLCAAVAAAVGVCGSAFALGRAAGAVLRLDRGRCSSLALACGMSNSSAGAVLITAAMPEKPYLLMPVLAYGLVQKSFAGLVVRRSRPCAPL
ncbi:sodium-dependent transporter [Streptomyces sp. NPDC001904]|uniref:sodium-dependent transporter n=1 Tax=Streptomyces sp. NPDC001904 TaxID=3154531 RepID=UPI00331875B2